MRQLLADSRSEPLRLMEEPSLESIPGLIDDLNSFMQEESIGTYEFHIVSHSNFHMNEYREHILSGLGWDAVLFSCITPLTEDLRLDRIRRFITLVFMQNDREIELIQDDDSHIWVQKVYDEAYNQRQGFSGEIEITG